MPVKVAKRVYRKRRNLKRKPLLRRKIYRKRNTNVPEYASLSCKRTLAGNVGGNFGLGQLYSMMNTQLADFPRAVQVAGAYQHYRIKKIAITFKPSYDTFQAGPGAVTKPRMYYMIDKSGSIPINVSLEGLKQMGARPRELDENSIVVKWSPSVLESTLTGVAPIATSPTKYQISPWLSTTAEPNYVGAFVASTVDHLGLYWYLDALNNPEGYQYQCEIEVQFQFKKPLTNAVATTEAFKVTLATIDNSSDGVVGGHDGVPTSTASQT